MITTIFSKTRPFNYVLVSILLILVFTTFSLFQNLFSSPKSVLLSVLGFGVIVVTIFLTNAIGIKNNLTKNNAYTVLFCFLFLLFFPQVFNNISCVIANFFVVLAVQRLVAVQSLKSIKQKIFDASILIFVASILQFWAILFIGLVFVIVMFYAARDYRNWIVPIIALLATTIIFLVFALQFNIQLIYNFNNFLNYDFNISYFTNTFQNISFAVYASISALFLINAVLTNSTKPLAHQALFRFVIFNYLIAMSVFLLVPDKNNSNLLFTMTPLAIMGANFFEALEIKWMSETSAIIIVLFAVVCFVGQL